MMGLGRILAGAAVAVFASNAAVAAPAIWRVSDADSSVFFLGSVHMLKADTEWRTPLLDDLLVTVDKVYFETDVGPAGQMAAVPLTFERGFYRDGTLLSRRIDEATMAEVRSAAEKYGLPVSQLLTMRPWMAATTLGVMALSKMGYDPLLGVETVLAAGLEPDRMGFLESAEEQIGFLAGGSEAEQIEMLQATLDGLAQMTAEIDDMVAAWQAGTPEELGDSFMAQMGAYDDAFTARLIDERNANWAIRVEQMLADNEEALLVVGAAHLIDDVSVVKLLENKGFMAERVQ